MAHQESGGRFWAPLAVDYGAYNPMRSGSIDGTDSIPHDRAVVRATTARCKYFTLFEGVWPGCGLGTRLLLIMISQG